MTDDQLKELAEKVAKRGSSPSGIRATLTPEEREKFNDYHHAALFERAKHRKKSKSSITTASWGHYIK